MPYCDEVESCLGLHGNADGVTLAPAKLTPAERHVVVWRSVVPEPARVMRPLRAAKESGRLTARHDTIARRVLTEGRRATGVGVVDRIAGAVPVLRADHVILCASPSRACGACSTPPRHGAGGKVELLGNPRGINE